MRLSRWTPEDELAHLDWFAQLSKDARRSVLRHIDRCVIEAGTKLQRRGLRTQWIWIVLAGSLEVSGDDAHAAEQLVRPGSAWGEVEVVLARPSAVEVTANERTELLSLPARAYLGLIADPTFSGAALHRLARTIVSRPVPLPC